MKAPRRTYSAIIERVVTGLVWIFAMAAFIPFLVLLWKVIGNGWEHFDPDLITQPAPLYNGTSATPIEQLSVFDGILNGIYGTIFIVSITILPAALLGLLAGIFIADHPSSRMASIVRQANHILLGTPAIIIGFIVYWWVVRPANHFSALAGGLALFLILFPAITDTTARILKQSPAALRESGLALGGSCFDVTCRIVLPAAGRRITATVICVTTRAMGKTVPFIVTAAGVDRMDWNLSGPANTLSVLIWDLFNNSAYIHLVWSAALFYLLLIVLLHYATHLIHPLYDEPIYT